MKIVLSMRYVEHDGRRVLQRLVGELELVVETESYLRLAGDPVWEDVPLDLT